MKTASPNCAPRSIAPPAANCSTRSSSTRSSTRSCGARPRWNPAPPRSAPFPTSRSPDRSGRRRAAPPRIRRRSGTPKPSPISDTVIFVAPPDREARLESRAPVIVKPAAEPVRQGAGRRQRSRSPADVARPGRATPDGGAQLGRRKHRIARPADARRHHRSRPRHGAARGRNAALGRRRPVRARQAFRRRGRLRAPALPDQCDPHADASGSMRRWRWCPTASP